MRAHPFDVRSFFEPQAQSSFRVALLAGIAGVKIILTAFDVPTAPPCEFCRELTECDHCLCPLRAHESGGDYCHDCEARDLPLIGDHCRAFACPHPPPANEDEAAYTLRVFMLNQRRVEARALVLDGNGADRESP